MYLLPFLVNSTIPLHSGCISVIEFLKELDEVKTRNKLDDLSCHHTIEIKACYKIFIAVAIGYSKISNVTDTC